MSTTARRHALLSTGTEFHRGSPRLREGARNQEAIPASCLNVDEKSLKRKRADGREYGLASPPGQSADGGGEKFALARGRAAPRVGLAGQGR